MIFCLFGGGGAADSRAARNIDLAHNAAIARIEVCGLTPVFVGKTDESAT